MKDLTAGPVFYPDADPINENWLRIMAATRENRANDIVRLSGGQYTLDDAHRIIREHQEEERQERP